MILELKSRYKRNVNYYDDYVGNFNTPLIAIKPKKGEELDYDQLPRSVVDKFLKTCSLVKKEKNFHVC